MFLTLSAQANAWSATRKMKKVVRFPKNLVTSPSTLICDSKRGEPGIISDQYTFHLVHLFAQNSSTSMIVLPVFYRFWIWNCSGHQKTKTQGKNLQGLEFTSIDSYFKNRFEITRLWTGERIGWRKKKILWGICPGGILLSPGHPEGNNVPWQAMNCVTKFLFFCMYQCTSVW